jgi:flagellar hook-length control protein FliK
VNVRVSQRAGDVQVTVRTGDTDLAQTLRQHLPELSDRLAQTGVHADLWRPSAPGGSSSEANANSARDDGQIYGRDAGGNAYGANSSNEQQNDQQNAQQAAWMNQLFGAEKEA